MFNLAYFKGQPNEYVIQYAGGKVAREGHGQAFFYFKYNTSIVVVPTSSSEASFVFNEQTSNFQPVNVQGQLTFRIVDPKRAAALLNFTIDLRQRNYIAPDPERLPQRITNLVQKATRAEIQSRTLEQALSETEVIARTVLANVRAGGELEPLGVEVLTLFFVSSKPTPEVAKALEAQYREGLLRRADEAIYARRAAAVEDERRIKENELATDITLEERRQQLVALASRNSEVEAESRGRAHEIESEFRTRAHEAYLSLYKDLDPRLLVALGFHKLGENAARIENLTITPDILASLLSAAKSAD